MTTVRALWWAMVIVGGAFAVPATSFLDIHRRADLWWALGLLTVGIGLALTARVVYAHLDPVERQPITPDSKRSAVVRLLLGAGVSVLGIVGLAAAFAAGRGVGYLLIGVAVIGLGVWALLGAWRAYRRTEAQG